MERLMKKVISFLLILIFSLGSFSGCANTAEEKNMLKGEFFNVLINYFNYTPEGSSLEEMNDSNNYDVEATTMVSWGLLDEKDAHNRLNKAITREIAVLACLNTLNIKKTGNIDDIKDADLCDYPQEVADAVATGLVSLEKGYFNGDDKMTYEECQQLLENTMQAKIDGKIADEDSYVNYAAGENAIGLSDADLGEDDFIILNGVEDTEYPENVDYSELKESRPKVSFMNLSHSGDETVEIVGTQAPYAPKYATCTVSTGVYLSKFKDAKEGDYIVYTGKMGYEPIYGGKLAETSGLRELPHADDLRFFSGYFVSATEAPQYNGSKRYIIKYRVAEEEETMAESKIGKTETIDDIAFDPIEINKLGFQFKIEPTSDKKGITASAKKAFSVSENKHGNWQDWKINPELTFIATISDMSVTTKDIDGFFKKNADYGSFKFVCNTSETFTLNSGGLRYVPDSNRNAKFWTSFSRSRFTSGQGAKEIKICNIPLEIPYTGLTVMIELKLCIQFDGKISITLWQNGNGFEASKKNGKVVFTSLKAKSDKELSFEANLDVGIKAIISLRCFLVKSAVVSGYVMFGVDIAMRFSVYKQDGTLEKDLVADPAEAKTFAPEQGYKYCFDLHGQLYFKGGLFDDNLVGKVCKKWDYNLSQWSFNLSKGALPSFGVHVEETGTVDECTRSEHHDDEQTTENNDKQAKRDGRFILSTTKVHMIDGTCTTVFVLGSPISDEKIKKSYVNGIQVKVHDKDIVEAWYDENTGRITLSTLQSGSTEVDIYLQKDKKTGKEYMQTFSVTISENMDLSDASFSVPDYANIPSLKL